MADLTKLTEMSNTYGRNPELVLAGGGNTSFKENGILYVKCSGISLGEITEDGFVSLQIDELERLMKKQYPAEDAEREAEFLADILDARCEEDKEKRPSVEALLHGFFPQKYVLHVHPALVNGLTCSVGGEKLLKEILGEQILWIPICRPGYTLGKICSKAMQEYRRCQGTDVQVVFLQNHGIFLAADTTEEIDDLLMDILHKLDVYVQETGQEKVKELKKLLPDFRIKYLPIREAAYFVSSRKHAQALFKPFTPDHIVYCGAVPLFVEKGKEPGQELENFRAEYGEYPKILLLQDIGAFALCHSEKEIRNAGLLLQDAMKVAYYAEKFGGIQPMTDEMINFITHWEAESYRKKQN